ncbi:MAG: branched-chain-amino-acid transaminase [Planctomycetota bacterium]|nr:branched-chain-amino-acid transaminase [Planctomycetota bacterium]
MSIKIWIDGEFYDKEHAKVSVFDHGLLYGDGVFEGIRAYHGKVFRLRQHVERLYASAKAIWLQVPIPQDEMSRRIEETVKANNLTEAYIRVLVTRGVGDLGLDPRKCPKASIVIIADKIQLYPPEFYKKGLEVVTAATPISHRENLNPRIKSLNYLGHILAKIEGIQAGVHEVVMLDPAGYVAECSGDNIFVVNPPDLKSGGKPVIRTPHANAGILKGVTRDAVIELALKAGYDLREELFTRYDLYTADEMFLTGTGAEIIAVVKVDGRVIGTGQPGPVTNELLQGFRELTKTGG